MLTKNFKWLLYGFNKVSGTAITPIWKNTDGDVIQKNPTITNLSKTENRNLYVGSGTTTPSVNDYNLKNKIDNLTLISHTSDPNYNMSGYPDISGYDTIPALTLTSIYRNDTQNDITVNEIGYFLAIDTSTTPIVEVLLCREIIEPVVIHSGETYSFVLTIG